MAMKRKRSAAGLQEKMVGRDSSALGSSDGDDEDFPIKKIKSSRIKETVCTAGFVIGLHNFAQ